MSGFQRICHEIGGEGVLPFHTEVTGGRELIRLSQSHPPLASVLVLVLHQQLAFLGTRCGSEQF